jgi:hypothetical protein
MELFPGTEGHLSARLLSYLVKIGAAFLFAQGFALVAALGDFILQGCDEAAFSLASLLVTFKVTGDRRY